MTFGEKLKELRQKHNLTQEELAEKIFVTRSAVSKYERGKGYPNVDGLRLISELFGVSVDYLLTETDKEEERALKKSRRTVLFCISFAFLALAVANAVAAFITRYPYSYIESIIGAAGYAAFALAALKFRDEKYPVRAIIISRAAIAAVLIIAAAGFFI